MTATETGSAGLWQCGLRMLTKHRMTEVHVVPISRSAMWRVYDGDGAVPVSEHESETDAEFAARLRAEQCGADLVVVHDRYHRTRQIAAAARGYRG